MGKWEILLLSWVCNLYCISLNALQSLYMHLWQSGAPKNQELKSSHRDVNKLARVKISRVETMSRNKTEAKLMKKQRPLSNLTGPKHNN